MVKIPKVKIPKVKNPKSIESIVAEMWDEFDKRAVAYGLGSADVDKIIGFVPNTILKIGESLLGFWNSLAKGGWANIGPRMLGPRFESGTLTKVGKRTFLAPAPMGSKTAIVIEKIDGKAGAEAVFGVYGRRGDLAQRKTITFPTNSSIPALSSMRKCRPYGSTSLSIASSTRSARR
jgi:hypothetical protein